MPGPLLQYQLSRKQNYLAGPSAKDREAAHQAAVDVARAELAQNPSSVMGSLSERQAVRRELAEIALRPTNVDQVSDNYHEWINRLNLCSPGE